VNYFGNLFEKYFAELLGCTLDKNEYEKIPEEKEKRADWKICCGKHKILVEQKSAIMRLSAKQQGMEHPDCEYFSWNCRVQERGEDEGASAMHGGALEEWDRDCVRCRKFRTGAYDNFTSRSFKGCHYGGLQ